MKRWKQIAAFALCAALLTASAAAAGNADDPAVSQSYLESVFSGAFLQEVSAATREAGYDLEAKTLQSAAQQLAEQRMASEQREPVRYSKSGALYTATGDRVTASLGTKLTATDGSLTAEGNGLIDVTAGVAVAHGMALTAGHTYLCADDQSGYMTASLVGYVVYQGVCTRYRSPDNQTDYASIADALASLGLFRGSTKGYDLNRTATRTEALVMFLRILGLEDEALASTAVNPFRDVPAWADRYAAYAYDKGLIRGTGGDVYNANKEVTARDYLTFLMRALGYQENTDFSWENAVAGAAQLGILTSGERQSLDRSGFYRAQMVYLSWRALMTQKTDRQLLLCALRDGGTVTAAQAAEAICCVAGGGIGQ